MPSKQVKRRGAKVVGTSTSLSIPEGYQNVQRASLALQHPSMAAQSSTRGHAPLPAGGSISPQETAALPPHKRILAAKERERFLARTVRAREIWSEDVVRAAELFVSPAEAQARDIDMEISTESWSCIKGGRVVPKAQGLQMYRGNFDISHAFLRQHLEQRGLWGLTTKQHDLPTISGEPEKEQMERDDIWAVNIMLQYVSEDFKARWCIQRPITAFELLEKLRKAYQSFRFMDLPIEMRRQIYELLVPTGERYNELKLTHNVAKLCTVSKEFVEEIPTLFFSRNFLELWPDTCGPEIVQEWARKAGLHNLRHLRSLKVNFWYYKGFGDIFHVTHSKESGLKVEVVESADYDYTTMDEHAEAHLALVERRKQDEQWQSNGVIDFFTLDADAVCRILYSTGLGEEDEDEMVDERNAYQVAYGRRLITLRYGGCPW